MARASGPGQPAGRCHIGRLAAGQDWPAKFASHPCRSPVALSAFTGFRFPTEVIVVAVRWYPRYGLSYRDVEELLAERGVEVDHVTGRR